MPKMKTKSAAKKRFRVTASGKIKRSCTGKNHILTKKDRKRREINYNTGSKLFKILEKQKRKKKNKK